MLRVKRMNPPGCTRRSTAAVCGIEFGTGDADEQQLAGRGMWVQ